MTKDDPDITQAITEIRERLTKLETDSRWMKQHLDEIKTKLDSILTQQNKVKTLERLVWVLIAAIMGLILRTFLI